MSPALASRSEVCKSKPRGHRVLLEHRIRDGWSHEFLFDYQWSTHQRSPSKAYLHGLGVLKSWIAKVQMLYMLLDEESRS